MLHQQHSPEHLAFPKSCKLKLDCISDKLYTTVLNLICPNPKPKNPRTWIHDALHPGIPENIELLWKASSPNRPRLNFRLNLPTPTGLHVISTVLVERPGARAFALLRFWRRTGDPRGPGLGLGVSMRRGQAAPATKATKMSSSSLRPPR